MDDPIGMRNNIYSLLGRTVNLFPKGGKEKEKIKQHIRRNQFDNNKLKFLQGKSLWLQAGPTQGQLNKNTKNIELQRTAM